jgi:folate-dependent phosphoribosylglycinamide formyltransferase PurN
MLIAKPIRVAVLCSHRAPGLLDLVERDPARGRSYEIVAAVTSELGFEGQARVAAHGVATRAHAIHEFYRRRGTNLYRDFNTRAAFDRETAALLARSSPDIVLLDGYLYLATRELLGAFSDRVLNLHFSELTLRHPDGRPRYPGLRAVRDAIRDGRPYTRATVHLVNQQPDGGAPLVESWPFPVSPLAADALALGAREMFNAYVFAHQEWMMRAASGRLLAAALRMIADGTMDLHTLAARDPAAVIPAMVDAHGHVSYRHAA